MATIIRNRRNNAMTDAAWAELTDAWDRLEEARHAAHMEVERLDALILPIFNQIRAALEA